MTVAEFNQQMHRLSDTYGAQHYKQERLTLIWNQVKDFGPGWFTSVVDGLLTAHRHAPLPADFSEAISLERERRWKREKAQHENDAKAFWEGTYQPEDVRMITGTIKKRMLGGVSDQEWEAFMGMLNGAARRRGA